MCPKERSETPVYMRNIGFDLRTSYDSNGRQEYVGMAYPGALDSEEKFQIFKIAYDANGRMTHRRYADNTDDFTKIWNSRENYDYEDI